ncbi:MAG: tetratricopeptide repeat protein, partial [Caldilineaceae bacterium]|nr:tetratricopeptide repeat protein [Caldilineaceae bacterium]
YMPFMWVRVGLAQGEFALARGEFEQAIALLDELYGDMERAGIWYLRADVLQLEGRTLLKLGNIDEAREVLQAARTAAETLGLCRAAADLSRPA